MQTPAEPLLTVDNILQAAGRTFRGDKGGSLKVLESEVGKDGLVRLHVVFDAPAETQQVFGWHMARVQFIAVNGKLVQETDNGVGQYMSLLDTAGKPYKLEGQGAAYDAMRRAMKEAFDRDPVFMGAGGTIPFVADFAKAFPKATLLLTGAGDPFSNAHSEDESVDLKDLERSTLAEALFFEYLAAR